MPKKKDEPREIPIKFAEVGKDAEEAEAKSLQEEQEGDKRSDEPPEAVLDEPVAEEPEKDLEAAAPDLQSQIDSLSAETLRPV